MKRDIDQRHGKRIVRKDGTVQFYGHTYNHPKLMGIIGYEVIVKSYGYDAIDVFFVERRQVKGKGLCWGKGNFICMIEAN